MLCERLASSERGLTSGGKSKAARATTSLRTASNSSGESRTSDSCASVAAPRAVAARLRTRWACAAATPGVHFAHVNLGGTLPPRTRLEPTLAF